MKNPCTYCDGGDGIHRIGCKNPDKLHVVWVEPVEIEVDYTLHPNRWTLICDRLIHFQCTNALTEYLIDGMSDPAHVRTIFSGYLYCPDGVYC